MRTKKVKICLAALAAVVWLVAGCKSPEAVAQETVSAFVLETAVSGQMREASVTSNERVSVSSSQGAFTLEDVPAYSGKTYAVVNGNVPYFTESELTDTSFESYSELDSLGRCGMAWASVGTDLMPTEERGVIGQIKPSGWHTVKYDNVDGKYLYNRCHLIGYQLTGENANEKNLITGTRNLNTEGMLPFENMVADYVEETGNHVLYRVTPVFEGDNLVASGVLMEGRSVEDNGEGILFCVYVYNAQPGITIDYADGSSWLTPSGQSLAETSEIETTGVAAQTEATALEEAFENTSPAVQAAPSSTEASQLESVDYILNKNTKKFHYPSCPSVEDMKESNKEPFSGTRDEAISRGYTPCKRCNP